MKIAILGSTGMLGQALSKAMPEAIQLTRETFRPFKIETLEALELTKDDYLINAIGAIPQKNPSNEEMIRINTLLPRWLSGATRARIIQPATDCVFKGEPGDKDESTPQTADDPYGITKKLGEVWGANFMNIRASIVGADNNSNAGLFEWMRSQPQGARIDGYANHRWNGVTTDAMARAIRGVIHSGQFTPGMLHFVPADDTTKLQLLKWMAQRAGRDDIRILPRITKPGIDRRIQTKYPIANAELWRLAGYDGAPEIEQLIREMACC